MPETPTAVVHVGPEGLALVALLACPRCGTSEELPPVNLSTELREGITLTRLTLVLPDFPVALHTCRLENKDDQDPQPLFMDRGGVGFCAPLDTYGDGSGSRSSSPPGAPGNAGTSRSTTPLDARSSRALRAELPVFESDREYWSFVRTIAIRTNVSELEIDAILETAQMMTAQVEAQEAVERAAVPVVPFPSAHPAGRRLRAVPDDSNGNWNCPACGIWGYQVTHSCHAPKQ